MTLRRRFLRHLGVLALAPLPWSSRPAGAATPWLTFRPAVFEVTADGALIWMRSDDDATLRVQYVDGDEWTTAKLSAPLRLSQATDFSGVIALENLAPDTFYRYRIADGEGRPRDAAFAAGSFRTAPRRQRDFAFVFSGDTHARYRPFDLFDVMSASNPHFFIHLGDTVYADSPRSRFRPTLDHYRFKHREIRADTHLQQFLATVPTFAIWDDHEVENDFTAVHPAIPFGRQAFREYWPIRNEPGDASSVLYRRFKWTEACEFFVLDTRQYRDQGEAGAGIGRTLLGQRQLAWLETGLKASAATFKFICSSVPFHLNGIDKWGGFKAERRQLVEFIESENIRNVIVLSADLHAAADLSNERSGIAEFLVGPIAAPLQPAPGSKSQARDLARPGSYLDDAYNFGLIRISNAGESLILRLEVVDARGQVRYAREITAAGMAAGK